MIHRVAWVLALCLALAAGCGGERDSRGTSGSAASPADAEVLHWTCAMHPQIQADAPGRCPICGMDLVPAGGGPSEQEGQHEHEHADSAASPADAEVLHWTCAMHPQIQADAPGRCPICGMDLVPAEGSPSEHAHESPAARIQLSDAAVALAEIRTVRAELRPLSVELRLSGRLEVDERRVREISSYVPGRIERLYVDFTGVEVRAGEPLLEIYSPELVSAQEELLQAQRAAEATSGSPLQSLRTSNQELLAAAREKLELLGLSKRQIAALERTGRPQTRVRIDAPLDGVVMHKAGVEGMYVKTGTHIYSVADLSELWAQLDAYESDLPWLRDDQEVRFTTRALPGASFRGRVAFIDPVLDPKTRTVHVRVDVANPEGKLKPGLYVQAVIDAGLSEEREPVLAIPATAPLITGRRAVVYVRDTAASVPTFEGREVVLGPRAGDWYTVVQGLSPGEEVVVQGAFKIDSALQIQARPSMMQPAGTPREDGGAHPHGGAP